MFNKIIKENQTTYVYNDSNRLHHYLFLHQLDFDTNSCYIQDLLLDLTVDPLRYISLSIVHICYEFLRYIESKILRGKILKYIENSYLN